jgi:iron complex outermembrane receptor protein
MSSGPPTFAPLLACLIMMSSSAAWGRASREYELNITSRPLAEALNEFHRQTGLYVLIVHDDEGRAARALARALKGKYTAEEALGELLKPTGLTFKLLSAQQILVLNPANAAARHSKVIEEVLVTGSRGDDAARADVVVWEGIDVADAALATIGEMAEYFPQTHSTRDVARTSGAQHAQLLGMGAATTLLLINGRPVPVGPASLAHNALDVGAIPTAAIDRMDILPDAASTKYGADAIGGAVNVTLRNHIPNPIVELRYGGAQGGAGERGASVMAGQSGPTWSFGVVFDTFARDFLLGAKRGYWSNGDFSRYGGIDDALLSAHHGGPARFWSIVPKAERTTASAAGEIQLTPDLVLSGEVFHSQRETVVQVDPASFALTVPETNAFNTFGRAVDATYVFAGIGPRREVARSEATRVGAGLSGEVAGWNWTVSIFGSKEDGERSWENEVDASQLAAALASNDPTRALDVFGAGLGGDPALLASLRAQPSTVSLSIQARGLSVALEGSPFELPVGRVWTQFGVERRGEAARIEDPGEQFGARNHERVVTSAFGELSVPLIDSDRRLSDVGELSATAGVRLDRYDNLRATFSHQFGMRWQPTRQWSLYVSHVASERAPSLFELFEPHTSMPLFIADLRRNEIASIPVLSGGNPRLGPSQASSLTAGVFFTPATVDGLRIGVASWHTAVAGQVMEASPIALLANEDRFAERVLRAAPDQGDMASAIPGRVIHVDTSPSNSGRVRMRGVDVQVSYNIQATAGQLTPRLTATWIREFQATNASDTPPGERISSAHPLRTIPRWNAVASVTWRRPEALELSLGARYVSSYADAAGAVLTGATIPAQTLFDTRAALDFDALVADDSPFKGFTATFGVQNVFDTAPQASPTALLYGLDDIAEDDLRQRFFFLKIAKSF